MPVLPRPNVSVSTPRNQDGSAGPETSVEVVIGRDSKCKSYTADGATRDEATGKIIRQILDDPKTIELLP